jgi:hypothetical protein
MDYLQIKEGVPTLVPPNTILTWDDNNRCTVEALVADGKDIDFGIVPLSYSEPPAVDLSKEYLIEDGYCSVNDKWYRNWIVSPISDEDKGRRVSAFKQHIVSMVQLRLDTFAKTRAYDSILSACTYATSNVPLFRSEGQYCVDIRDLTWSTLYNHLQDVNNGTVPMPKSYDDIEPILPKLTWEGLDNKEI